MYLAAVRVHGGLVPSSKSLLLLLLYSSKQTKWNVWNSRNRVDFLHRNKQDETGLGLYRIRKGDALFVSVGKVNFGPYHFIYSPCSSTCGSPTFARRHIVHFLYRLLKRCGGNYITFNNLPAWTIPENLWDGWYQHSLGFRWSFINSVSSLIMGYAINECQANTGIINLSLTTQNNPKAAQKQAQP